MTLPDDNQPISPPKLHWLWWREKNLSFGPYYLRAGAEADWEMHARKYPDRNLIILNVEEMAAVMETQTGYYTAYDQWSVSGREGYDQDNLEGAGA